MKAITILTTTETKEDAQRIAHALVEERLAACAQVLGPMESVYRWQGKVETAGEWLCLIKTGQKMFEKAEACIRKNHPYQTPEIIALPIVAASDDYLDWLKAQID